MRTRLFVCFTDGDYDPTYAPFEDARIIESRSPDYYPCAVTERVREAKVVPETPEEIIAYARIMGWNITYLNGKISLVTHCEIEEDALIFLLSEESDD
jgi:hypothetical protein